MGEATKVVIVNASPKGEYSLTLQYARYLVTREPNIEWSIINVGQQLTDMEYDKAWFAESLVLLEQCEAIIWATPVYTMLVPWQLIRYFELVRQARKNSVFKDKYATSVMSCFHYFDNLAEQWLYGTCEDLGMHFMEGFSVDNIDLLKADFRSSMRFFMQEFHQATLNRTVMIRRSNVLKDVSSPVFKPTLGDAATAKKKDIRTVLLTDEQNSDSNLSAMIKVFLAAYPNEVEVVDINDFPYEGACQGCLKCELVGPCDRKDGFQDFYQNLVNTCDVLVHAMNIEGRYVKPIWKLFLDRTFSNGHRTSMMGKHTCYLVAGPLSQLFNVKEFLEGKDRVGKENSMGVISDECPDSAHLQALIEQLAVRLDRACRAKYQKGVNFLGVGGM
ncbi:MAG: iron-sulfur protein, partial [Spirochaetia bacterium]|nr:iron-sulfur protein [Spirochaetia bacterium]